MPTGPGGLDSNGIWQFGEDDSEALASDLLNLGMASISTEVGLLDAAVAAIVTGQILQVVSVTKTDTFSTSSTSVVDVTDLTATITPSATSSKIIVTASIPFGHSASDNSILMFRDASNNSLLNPDSPSSRSASFFAGAPRNTNTMVPARFTFSHSPSTTSAFTYKVSCKTSAGTFLVNRSGADTDNANLGRGVATIILMELAG